MINKSILISLCFALSLCLSNQLSAQMISGATHLGWSVPGGSGVSDQPEDLNLQGGLVWGADLLYHINENLGAGLLYNTSFLAGTGGDSGVFGIEAFGFRMIGLKGFYQLRSEGFTPFASLSLGVTRLRSPEVTLTDVDGNTLNTDSFQSISIGIMPELGIRVRGFYIATQYVVPVGYQIPEIFEGKKALGTFNINIGYRYVLDL